MSSTKTVSFTRMEDGTVDDWRIITENNEVTDRDLVERIVKHLTLHAEDDGAYQIDRLQHALQTATRAERDGADDDWIVASLLHDVGDLLAPHAHGQLAAEILRPYVCEEVVWVVRHHGIFQQHYNRLLSPEEQAAREAFRDHPFYDATVAFCANWDQVSFDPDYDSLPLQHFMPHLERVFSREPFGKR